MSETFRRSFIVDQQTPLPVVEKSIRRSRSSSVANSHIDNLRINIKSVLKHHGLRQVDNQPKYEEIWRRKLGLRTHFIQYFDNSVDISIVFRGYTNELQVEKLIYKEKYAGDQQPIWILVNEKTTIYDGCEKKRRIDSTVHGCIIPAVNNFLEEAHKDISATVIQSWLKMLMQKRKSRLISDTTKSKNSIIIPYLPLVGSLRTPQEREEMRIRWGTEPSIRHSSRYKRKWKKGQSQIPCNTVGCTAAAVEIRTWLGKTYCKKCHCKCISDLIAVQAAARKYFVRTRLKKHFKESQKEIAAIMIQSWYRMCKEKKAYLDIKKYVFTLIAGMEMPNSTLPEKLTTSYRSPESKLKQDTHSLNSSYATQTTRKKMEQWSFPNSQHSKQASGKSQKLQSSRILSRQTKDKQQKALFDMQVNKYTDGTLFLKPKSSYMSSIQDSRRLQENFHNILQDLVQIGRRSSSTTLKLVLPYVLQSQEGGKRLRESSYAAQAATDSEFPLQPTSEYSSSARKEDKRLKEQFYDAQAGTEANNFLPKPTSKYSSLAQEENKRLKERFYTTPADMQFSNNQIPQPTSEYIYLTQEEDERLKEQFYASQNGTQTNINLAKSSHYVSPAKEEDKRLQESFYAAQVDIPFSNNLPQKQTSNYMSSADEDKILSGRFSTSQDTLQAIHNLSLLMTPQHRLSTEEADKAQQSFYGAQNDRFHLGHYPHRTRTSLISYWSSLHDVSLIIGDVVWEILEIGVKHS